MTEFNVGDKVKAKAEHCNRYVFSGKVVTIREITCGGERFQTDDSLYREYDYLLDHFELVEAAIDPIASAKELLERRGFTIIAPEPRTRRVVAYTFGETGVIHFAEQGYFNCNKNTFSDTLVIIETFDWTESMNKKPS